MLSEDCSIFMSACGCSGIIKGPLLPQAVNKVKKNRSSNTCLILEEGCLNILNI